MSWLVGFHAGEAGKIAAEEAGYDRGYDDGWKARDEIAGRLNTKFREGVLAVLREVGLLGNIAPCP